jgi:hypothetical protein
MIDWLGSCVCLYVHIKARFQVALAVSSTRIYRHQHLKFSYVDLCEGKGVIIAKQV